MQIKVAPAIMDADLGHLADAIKLVEEAGADLLHIDIMDGHFVPSFVGCRRVVRAVKRYASIPVDVHMMVSNPEEAVPWFLDAGADIVLFHAEAARDAASLVERIHKAGARAGIALKPREDVESIREAAPELDCVMAMTVNPGFSGQKFMEEGCQKIPALRRMCRKDVDVYVDGGIDHHTAQVAVSYGANVLAAASAIFASDIGPAAAMKRLRAAAQEAARRAESAPN